MRSSCAKGDPCAEGGAGTAEPACSPGVDCCPANPGVDVFVDPTAGSDDEASALRPPVRAHLVPLSPQQAKAPPRQICWRQDGAGTDRSLSYGREPP